MPKTDVDFQVGEQCFYYEEDYIYICRVIARTLEPVEDDQLLTLTLEVLEHIQESTIFKTTAVGERFTVSAMVEASKCLPPGMSWRITDYIANEIR